MLVSLMLPIALSAIALFFASFLLWMIFQLHKDDWRKIEKEAEFMTAAANCNIPEGNYMFPRPDTHAEMQTEAFQKKYDAGPRGILTILPKVNMGQNLGLTIVYFLVVSILLGYLGTMALPKGAEFLAVFRFMFTAAFMTFLAAMVQHAIWFRPRIVGHIIESIGYAAIVGVIFASLWPSA
jgi:hypothetical protein